MLMQWKNFPTSLEQSLLKVICVTIVRCCPVHGKVVRWEQAESYSVDQDEVDKYAAELAVDLKAAEETHLIPFGYFEEGSPTELDIPMQEKRVPTIINDTELAEDEPGLTEDESGLTILADQAGQAYGGEREDVGDEGEGEDVLFS